jgi:hypothetical protein
MFDHLYEMVITKPLHPLNRPEEALDGVQSLLNIS